MRCTSCGFPLSPSRVNSTCPRCGTFIGSGQKAPEPPKQLSQSGQMLFQGPISQPGFSPGTLPPIEANPPGYSRKTMLGFTLAGLCILTGGLILVFIYFLASGLSGYSSNNTVTTNSITHVSTHTTAPTATAIPSPTATTYPGQQYIDNAQMASAVDVNSLQPTQLTTTFKTNQKIYVAFQLHPAGHSGAVCLIWYLKGAQITQYSFAVGANSKLSYAYSFYGSAGPAYVEIYWANTTQCTDRVLAQHVDFTVIN